MNINWQLVSQILQLVIAVFIILLVLVQSKGKGLSSTVSGSISFYRSRRGLEKLIFVATIILGVALVVNSVFLIL